ncbi:helix-turn-helix transcriptional regulator [Paracoccus niistensis]|uniref:Helix-turn-helix transcriptional regulator n=1 Tax=Paracoccus niistensis TaxID=632935 RepID=A0ABV6I666_9RHOB
MSKIVLRLGEVSERYDTPIPTLYANIKKGNFPKPLKIGKVARWRLEDLEAWEKEKMSPAESV